MDVEIVLSQAREHMQAQAFATAEETLWKILEAEPRNQEALKCLGETALRLGPGTRSLELMRKLARLSPDSALEGWVLGHVLFSLGIIKEAVSSYRESLGIDPVWAEAWFGLGNCYLELREFAAASECLQHSLDRSPENPAAQHNLAKSLFKLGSLEDAMPLFRKAARSGSPVTRASIAMVIPGDPGADNRGVLEERRNWAQEALPRPGQERAWTDRDRDPERLLNVGYVSSFFNGHNWMKAVWGLVNRHDREKFRIHLFAREGPGQGYLPSKEDKVHAVEKLEVGQLEGLIRAEKIDILVDLNGYSDMKLLPLIAVHPAPLVVGWFNMYASSGIPAYDYLIGDDVVAPPGEEELYSEEVLRVTPSYLCFEVFYPVPELAPPPCLESTRVTFGCLAPQYKITDRVISAWAEILRQCPDSALLLRNNTLGSSANRLYLTERFENQGVPAERLSLEGPSEHFEFLATYSRTDYALDTFPYNGGTTTMEALWQGVPVITFDGDRWASRTSASILRAAGLSEYVAEDLQSYVDLAVRCANETVPEQLAEKRARFRHRVGSSPVCDVAGFTRNMEALYRQIWRSWCRG